MSQINKLVRFLTSFNIVAIYFAILTTIGILFLGSVYPQSLPKPYEPTKNVQYGILDPAGTFNNSADISIENIVTTFSASDIKSLPEKIKRIESLDRQILLTLHPIGEKTEKFIFNQILEGDYDSQIKQICSNIAQTNKPVLFNFAPNMDLPTFDRYQWSNQDSRTTRLGFRRAVDLCKKQSPEITVVWSPYGEASMLSYYPGNDYVDIIGLSVISNQAWELENLESNQSFSDIFDPKYDAVKNLERDIIITELAVSGTKKYTTDWLEQALGRISSPILQRNLKTVVYKNVVDDFKWLEQENAPDFRITINQYPNTTK